MSLLRKTKKLSIVGNPYKASPSKNLPVVDDPELAARMFGGSKYDMIVIAAARSRQLRKEHCSGPVLPEHQPTVMALLEIQAGKITMADVAAAAANEDKLFN